MESFFDYRSPEEDSMGMKILTGQKYPGFGLATISTMSSLQGLDTSLFHDQLSPMLGIGSRRSDPVEIGSSRRVHAERSRNKPMGREEERTETSHACAAGLKGVDGAKTEVSAQSGNHQSQIQELESGIRTLYRMESGPPRGCHVGGHLAPGATRVRVNGLEMKVIPSARPSEGSRTRKVPSGFSSSDQLVEYYLGKVLRSSNSLFYIEKKLQQALYGAVFLAFELEEEERWGGQAGLQSQGLESFRFDPAKSRVAIKVSSMSLRKRRSSLREDIEAEVVYSGSMRGHRNVLEYSEIWQDSFKNIYVKMDYAEHEDLFEVMRRRRRPLTENEARWLFAQIFNAVISLHNNNMAMRDLSLENILMFNREPHFFDLSQDPDILGVIHPGDSIVVPKVTDPGQACRICPKEKDEVSNIWKVYQRHPRDSGFQLQKVDFLFGKSFRPPEAYQTGSLYDPTKVDVFCLGWMLLFTLTKYQPFETCRLVTDHQKQHTLKNEGLIHSFFGKLVPGNGRDDKVPEMNGKTYVSKDQNWSLILNGRILDLFRKIKASNLSTEAQDLIENMLIPDFKERFSMQNVIQHPWLKSTSSKQSQYFTPIMASTLAPTRLHKSSSKQHKQSPNIVNPSVFFRKPEKDKRNPSSSSSKKNNNSPDSTKMQQTGTLISKVNNDYLCSMVKRTNDKLNMTRINITKRKDSDVESLIRSMNSSSISSQKKTVNPTIPDRDLINQKLASPLLTGRSKQTRSGAHHVHHTNPCKRSEHPPPPPTSTHTRKKNSESNFILDLWSFFSNGGPKTSANAHHKEHILPN